MNRHRITVIGASNIDISATALDALQYGDSNPGKVVTGLGGVGRNIAENLARLGQDVRLITAYGSDAFARLLKQHAQDVGMDVSQSITAPHFSSSVYICINSADGEMAVAVNDMDVCSLLNPAWLSSRMDIINQTEALVLDANLSEEALAYAAQNCRVKVFAESVSAPKAVRLRPILAHVTGLKANRLECELLTGIPISCRADVERAANALHASGVQFVFITLGKHGAFASDGLVSVFLPPMNRSPLNTTGCGDALYAGCIAACLDGADCRGVLRMGLASAAVCAASPHAVSPDISPASVEQTLLQDKEEPYDDAF